MMGLLVFGVQFMLSFSDSQRLKLIENSNVEEITEKHIHFSSSFKIKAVESYIAGTHPQTIFENAGFDPSYFEKDYCLHTVKRWKKKYEKEGKDSLKKNSSGIKATGRPKSENLDELTYEELQVIVQIQREVILELELKKEMALAKKK